MKRAVSATTAAAFMATAIAHAETTAVTVEKDGTFTVASNSRPGESTPAEEGINAFKAAYEFCHGRGQQVHVLSVKAKSSGVNRVASSRIYFECVGRPSPSQIPIK